MKPLTQFLVLTFLLFLIGFALVGLLFAIDGPQYLVVTLQVVMAWTPTAAYALIHHKVEPELSFWRFAADQFKPRLSLLPFLASVLIPVCATGIAWTGYSLATGTAMRDLIVELSLTGVLTMFLDSLIRGPLGEELGWRGFLLGEFNKRHTLLRSSLLVGLIWSVWHLPLWFVSGFEGIDLLLYIGFFTIGLTAFSVIMGFIYRSRGGNLLYAVLLHQMLNFSGRLLDIDELTVLGASSAVYVLIAVVISLIALKSDRRGALPA